jgi:hypothetical protein
MLSHDSWSHLIGTPITDTLAQLILSVNPAIGKLTSQDIA